MKSRFTIRILASALQIGLFFFASKVSHSQTHYLLGPTKNPKESSVLFENQDRIGLGIPMLSSNPAANLHLYTFHTNETPVFLAQDTSSTTYREIGSVRLFLSKYNINYSIFQSGTSFSNYFEGKTGFGTINPQYIIDVDGNIGCSSNLIFTNGQNNDGIKITNPDQIFSITYLRSPHGAPSFVPVTLNHGSLTVQDTITSSAICITNSAGLNKILVSNEMGYGQWTDASLFHDDDWLISTVGKTGTEPPPGEMHSLYFNDRKYLNVGIGTEQPLQKLHMVDGNILISRSGSKAPGSVNGSILFGEVVANDSPLGEWGIEYYHEGLNFWKVGNVNWTGRNNCLFLKNDGNVGVGTDIPKSKLHVLDGNILISNSEANIPGNIGGSMLFGEIANEESPLGEWGIDYYNGGLNFWKTSSLNGPEKNYCLFIRNDGNIGIGTSTPQTKLAVNGIITAKELKITLTGFPDYVFNEDYNLLSLKETEDYIKKNHHLPDIPTEKEVKEHGLNIGEMNAALLKKVEELTLHIITLNKRVEQLENERNHNVK